VLHGADALSKDAPSVNYNYTPLWTAPEVLVGDYNAKVDIWSLGCVIIEMASAKPPWSEENFENPFRALYHIGNSNSIPKIPDTLSEIAKDLVRLCLQRLVQTQRSVCASASLSPL
jgi:serine/threonine protein kinase